MMQHIWRFLHPIRYRRWRQRVHAQADSTGWTPLELPGLVAWFVPTDEDVKQEKGSVTQWNELSRPWGEQR